MKKYKSVDPSLNVLSIDTKIIGFWTKHKIFEKSVAKNKDETFIFYDGPPFANGMPHYGHLLTGFIKDTYARFHTMLGKKVERKFGWDCHGLPAEMPAEKELGLSGRKTIVDYGIDKFNAYCKKSVMKYSDNWEDYVVRQARWVDFKNSYKTMDINFMESTMWVFKSLYDKGLVYLSEKVMPYSWACETPLSNFETRIDNAYRERTDQSVTVSFELLQAPEFIKHRCEKCNLLAWTTTPWTLPSNLALAVNPKITYVAVIKNSECYILSKSSLIKYENEVGANVIHEFPGSMLEEYKYQPMFDYFSTNENSFRILCADFVLDADGTGIVHMSPGFGEEDHALCTSKNIKLVCPVDSKGKFTSEIRDFEGINIFDANEKIINTLKQKKCWIRTESTTRNYPHCWRTDTPLIYKAVSSWYIKVTAIKDRLIELNQQINWIPHHVKDGLVGKWLENAKDWAISRNRFWGTPIPIWTSDNPTYPRIDVYGSIAELERDFGTKITDLHMPFIDSLVRPNPDDPSGLSMMRRVPDIFDCWFESGSMPYGQAHYPFENKEWFENNFPADFITEYVAQTRGWFYTLMVISTALFDKPPFLNCICHGTVLDISGQKLSKRLNNYKDPMSIFEQYGSDALRFAMISSAVVHGHDLLIDAEGKVVYDTLRLVIKPIWSAYHFFVLYANADSVSAKKIDQNNAPPNSLDAYILCKLQDAKSQIISNLSVFDTQKACNALINFFDTLNNWYIRRSRSRFWKTIKDTDKQYAYDTLYTTLIEVSIVMAPLLPLIAEEIYLNLIKNDLDGRESVHLLPLHRANYIFYDNNLVSSMDKTIEICSAGLFVRNQNNIRTRQPLKSITVVGKHHADAKIFTNLIMEELNVKNVKFGLDYETYAHREVTIRFPIVGKRLPHKVKEIIDCKKNNIWSISDSGELLIAGVALKPDEFSYSYEPISGYTIKNIPNSDSIVVLDTEITHELYIEGISRDIIRFIQQLRKDIDLNITDRIKITISSESADITNAFFKYIDVIMEQCLCTYDENVAKSTSVIQRDSVIDNKRLIVSLLLEDADRV